MQIATPAEHFGGTENRERRTDAPTHDLGSRILTLARAAAALHMATTTHGSANTGSSHGRGTTFPANAIPRQTQKAAR